MLSTKNKKKSRNEKEKIPSLCMERIRMMDGMIDESEISAKERAEAWQLEAMLQLLNYPEEGDEYDDDDAQTEDDKSDNSLTKDEKSDEFPTNNKKAAGKDKTKDDNSGDIRTRDRKYNYTSDSSEEEELVDCGSFPGKIKAAVRPMRNSGCDDYFFDKERAKAEQLELQLLELNDYEARLDDDFIGEGKTSSTNAGCKTTALSFYNADATKADQRVLAEDLDFKLINDHETCLNEDFISKGKVDIPSRYAKSAPTFAALHSVGVNDDLMSEMADEDRIECPYYQAWEPDVYGLEGDEFEEMSADSSIVFTLF